MKRSERNSIAGAVSLSDSELELLLKLLGQAEDRYKGSVKEQMDKALGQPSKQIEEVAKLRDKLHEELERRKLL